MQEPIKFSDQELHSMHIAIGKSVKKYRQEKGLTQLQLSQAMGYSSISLVSAAELASDGKHFNLEHLYKIAKILDLKISDFLAEH